MKWSLINPQYVLISAIYSSSGPKACEPRHCQPASEYLGISSLVAFPLVSSRHRVSHRCPQAYTPHPDSPLWFSLCLSPCLAPLASSSFFLFFYFFYFFTLSDIPTSLRRPSIHLYSLFLSSESCRHPRFGTRTTFCRLPAGPAAIILRIDLCCIDER